MIATFTPWPVLPARWTSRRRCARRPRRCRTRGRRCRVGGRDELAVELDRRRRPGRRASFLSWPRGISAPRPSMSLSCMLDLAAEALDGLGRGLARAALERDDDLEVLGGGPVAAGAALGDAPNDGGRRQGGEDKRRQDEDEPGSTCRTSHDGPHAGDFRALECVTVRRSGRAIQGDSARAGTGLVRPPGMSGPHREDGVPWPTHRDRRSRSAVVTADRVRDRRRPSSWFGRATAGSRSC